MALSENTKITVNIATIVSIVGGAVMCGATWAVYSQRLEALEVQASETAKEARQLDKTLIEVNAKFEEIIRRAERIEKKLDWYEQQRRYKNDERN